MKINRLIIHALVCSSPTFTGSHSSASHALGAASIDTATVLLSINDLLQCSFGRYASDGLRGTRVAPVGR
jgi:hypothetical protein